MRRTIGARLGESYREAVHVTLSREIDAETLVAVAERMGDETDADVSIIDPLLLAVSATLDEHPTFNATFEDETLRVYDEHNIALAVAVESGLLTPVIADAASLSISELARERRRVTDLVQTGEHSMSDLRGSTFTVSNLGPLGVDSFTQIINPPEVAILGIGRVRERATPSESESGVAFRKQLTVDLSLDHRIVDGADGARFLQTLAGHVAEAERFIDAE